MCRKRTYLKGVLVVERMMFQAECTEESMVAMVVQLLWSFEPWNWAVSK